MTKLVFEEVAQTVKNMPAVQKTGIRSLGWEDPWRRKWQPMPVLLPGEFRGQRSLGATVHGVPQSRTRLSD